MLLQKQQLQTPRLNQNVCMKYIFTKITANLIHMKHFFDLLDVCRVKLKLNYEWGIVISTLYIGHMGDRSHIGVVHILLLRNQLRGVSK